MNKDVSIPDTQGPKCMGHANYNHTLETKAMVQSHSREMTLIINFCTPF